MQIHFALEKTTPGAVRFQEVNEQGTPLKIGDGAKVGTLYLRKTALGNEVPQKLKVTVEVG